jgi:hypothetical protein
MADPRFCHSLPADSMAFTLHWCFAVIALTAMTAFGADPPKWGDDATKNLREAMKKNKYEEICAFYGTVKQVGIGQRDAATIKIDHHSSWSIVVSVEKIDKKADLLTAAEGQDITLAMDFPLHVGVTKNDLGANFYFILWRERHNDVDYHTLTAIKRDGSPMDQFAPKDRLEAEAALEPGKNKAQEPQCVQPDYAKWELVREGMSEEEVTKLLGDPLHDTGIPEEFRNNPTYVKFLTYGRIAFTSPAMPSSFEFDIAIKQGNVSEKYDPFGGELSKDGRPTAPMQITPKDRTIFDHFPRFVDLRWQPSSGEYPVVYVVEVQTGQYGVIEGKDTLVYVSKRHYRASCPYQAFSFGGKNAGRWRVMAVNKKGQSAWTEWHYFRFEK